MEAFGSPAFFFPMGDGRQIPVFNMGGIRKAQRVQKAKATKEATKQAAAAWAATAGARPFAVADLADPDKFDDAFDFFSSLSTSDLKSECKMHGLPITGAKYKLVDSLCKAAGKAKFGNPSRGVPGEGATPTARLTASDAGKVRRALVADLRKGLVFDKKFKKNKWSPGSVKKRLSARYSNCTAEVFQALFPHSAGKKKCALQLEHLQIDRLGKSLRYGSCVEHVPGSLSAQFDEAAGTISISGKYTMEMIW